MRGMIVKYRTGVKRDGDIQLAALRLAQGKLPAHGGQEKIALSDLVGSNQHIEIPTLCFQKYPFSAPISSFLGSKWRF